MTDSQWQEQAISEGSHSQEFCLMFFGYLTGRLPELHDVAPSRLLEAWDQFQLEMRNQSETQIT